jgi:hypothetical protein
VARVNGGVLVSNGAVRAVDTGSVFISGSQIGGTPVSLLALGAAKIVVTASTVSGQKNGASIRCVASFDSNLLPLVDCP